MSVYVVECPECRERKLIKAIRVDDKVLRCDKCGVLFAVNPCKEIDCVVKKY